MKLLHAVMQKFSRPEVLPQASGQPQAMSLTQLMANYAPLIDLQSRRQLLTVEIDDQRELFQTLILDINFSQKLLIVDELFPTLPQPKLGQRLRFSHQHQGKLLVFDGPVIQQESIGGSPCYLVPLPEQLDYRQRRRHPRLGFTDICLPVKLQSPTRAHWFGSLINLSASGMRLAVNGDKLAEINRGSRLPAIEFSLSKQLCIRCEGRIRSYRFSRRPNRQTEISVEFTNLNAEQYALLSQYVDGLLAHSYRAA